LKNFTDHIQEVIFQKTSEYLSDCVGTDNWGEELHEAHGLIMQLVKAINKKMNIK
jgi:hypothetical protein